MHVRYASEEQFLPTELAEVWGNGISGLGFLGVRGLCFLTLCYWALWYVPWTL